MKRSLAEALPYYGLYTIPTRQRWPFSMVALKDGTVSAGFRMRPFDTFGLSAHERNQIADSLLEGLHALPPDVFLQVVFETGDDYEDLIAAFGNRSAPESHPLLRRSRKIRADACRTVSAGTKPRITWWLGWRGALCVDERFAKRWRKALKNRFTKQRIFNAGQALADVCEEFFERVTLGNVAAEPLAEADVLADLHRAVSPNRYRDTAPPFSEASLEEFGDLQCNQPMTVDRRGLSTRLAAVNMRISDTMLRFFNPDFVQRVTGITQYPSATHFGWLDPIFYQRAPHGPFRVTVTHLATDKTVAVEELGKQQRKLFGQVGERFYPPQDLVAAANAHLEVVRELGHSSSRVFHTSIQVVVSAKDVDDLDQETRRVCAGFQDCKAQAGTRVGEQLQAWKASLPGNGHVLWRDTLNRTYQLLSRNAAHSTPIWLPELGSDDPDLLVQTRQNTWRGFNMGIMEGREDASGVIIGKTGSGKTFLFLMLVKLGILDRGGHAILTDVKGPERSSLKPLCDVVGGNYKCLDSDYSCSFNPCPPFAAVYDNGQYLVKSTRDLRDMLCMMGCPDWEHNDNYNFFAEVASRVIELTYESRRKNATRNVMLEDIVASFDLYKKEALSDGLTAVAEDMRKRLLMWCRLEEKARLINRPEPLDMDNRLTVFDFYGVDRDRDLHAVLMASLFNAVERKLSTLPFDLPKLIGSDEAKVLFGKSPAAQALVENKFRTARAVGAIAYAISQHHRDVIENPAMKANASMVFLMRHASDHAHVADAFELSARETALFRSLQFRGGHFAECMVKDVNQNKTEILRYSPTSFDLWLDTSRGADVEFRRQYQAANRLTMLETIDKLSQRYPHGVPKSKDEVDDDFFEDAGGGAEMDVA